MKKTKKKNKIDTDLNQEARIDFWTIVVANSFKRAHTKQLKKAKAKLSFEMYLVLNALWQQDGQTRKNLALFLRKTPGSVSQIADKLKKKNYIRVDKSNKKRRYYLLPEGKKIQTKISRSSIATMENALSNITKEEREICLGVLKRMFLNMEIEELKN